MRTKKPEANRVQLTASSVDGRNGWVDSTRQVYAAPKSAKRVEHWKKKMEAKGHKF